METPLLLNTDASTDFSSACFFDVTLLDGSVLAVLMPPNSMQYMSLGSKRLPRINTQSRCLSPVKTPASPQLSFKGELPSRSQPATIQKGTSPCSPPPKFSTLFRTSSGTKQGTQRQEVKPLACNVLEIKTRNLHEKAT